MFNVDISLQSSGDSKVLMPAIKTEKLPFTGVEVEPMKGIKGPSCFTKDRIFFSELLFDKKNNKLVHKICSKPRNGGLIDILPINDEQASSLHPFLSEDGQKLFFSSDRAGGKGGYDLYVSIFEKGKWGKPVNITYLNTSGDEFYPVLLKDKLYFSSNGWPGLGGADILSASILQEEAPQNLGYPLNSSSDENGISFIDSTSGYISSNRYGGDDVFRFDYMSAKVIIKSFVLSAQTGLRMPNVSVFLEQQDESGKWTEIEKQETNHTGIYSFLLKPNRSNYRIRLNRPGFIEAIQYVNSTGINFSKEEKYISLKPE